jgi:hypothetical protein
MARRRVNVGGTSGGLGELLIGLLLIAVGFYMIFTNTIVFTSFWYFQDFNLLGPLIVVFMVGLVFLCLNGHSVLGWMLCSGAILAITVGIIMNLRFQFRSITLLSALIMFGLPAVGCGFVLRALRTHDRLETL